MEEITYCKRGHLKTDDNVYVTKKAARLCRTCMRMKDAERRRAQGIPERPPTLPLKERFESYTRVVESGCIEWTGYVTPHGYGMFSIEGRRTMAHRVAWMFAYGEWPPAWPASGMVLHHTCSNRRCVNPEHLRLITHEENMKAPKSRGKDRKIRHCKCCPHYSE